MTASLARALLLPLVLLASAPPARCGRGAGGFGSALGSGLSSVGSGLGAVGSHLSATVSRLNDVCARDITFEFRRALYNFSTELYKQVSKRNENHFAVSQFSAWQALAALYEAQGAEQPGAEPLRAALRLPHEACLRRKYYALAASLEPPGDDVTLRRRRVLLLPAGAEVNATWAAEVEAAGLLTVLPPGAPAPADVPAPPPGAGPLLLDSLEYSGLFEAAFADADVAHDAPFKDDSGKVIGKVDLLRINTRVKLAHLPLLGAKVVELAVGRGGRYRLLMLVNLGTAPITRTIKTFSNTIIIDIFENLRESLIPLQVAIPRFSLAWEGALGAGLGELGVRLGEQAPAMGWRGAGGVAGALQRVRLSVTGAGLAPPEPGALGVLGADLLGVATGLAAAVGRDFTADRPFMFGLVDSVTRTCLFTGAYTHP